MNSTKSVTSIFSPSGLHRLSRYEGWHLQIDSETAILQAQLNIEGLFSSSTDTATALGLYYLLVQKWKNNVSNMKKIRVSVWKIETLPFPQDWEGGGTLLWWVVKTDRWGIWVGQVGLDQRPSYEVSEIVFSPFLESDFFFPCGWFFKNHFCWNLWEVFCSFLKTRPGRMSRCWFSKISTSRRLLAKQRIRFCLVLKEA